MYKRQLYKKILKRTKKFKAHDENNEAGIGDRVEIMETRKISIRKDGIAANDPGPMPEP